LTPRPPEPDENDGDDEYNEPMPDVPPDDDESSE
jgi:hypothetical protein